MTIQALRVWAAAGTLALACILSVAASMPPSAAPMPERTYLSQSWNVHDRDVFYFTSQGSELMPYDWFLSLEQSASQTLFRENLQRFGFLPGTQSTLNPDLLPLGFVKDVDAHNVGGLDTKEWVGLTCAACHTGAIRYGGGSTGHPPSLLVIDGAPTRADFGEFVRQLGPAVADTDSDSGKFDRFASRVLGPSADIASRQRLRTRFGHFADQFARFEQSSRPTTEWGPGRVDAFGMIFNRVCSLDLDMPHNSYPPDAPVSYPFLWNVNRQDHIQWHGEVPNNGFIERLGRNTGEVLGVFAQIQFSPGKPFYMSTVKRQGLLKLDREMGKLTAPKWPEQILGPIDRAAASRGQNLYRQDCARCHTTLVGPHQIAHIHPYSLAVIGTDPAMTVNVHTRTVQTGSLQGHHKDFVPIGPIFGPTAFAHELIQNAVIGALVNPNILTLGAAARNAIPDGASPVALANNQLTSVYTPTSTSDLNAIGYEARPLHGIWATAPFLHNGSVPSLYQLLLPPQQRVKTFFVGTYEFDPVQVGYRTAPDPTGHMFDTSLPGNHNTGHNYGTGLSPDQRRDLVEFLKTL